VLVKDLVKVQFSLPSGVAEAAANLLTEEGGGVEQRDAETSDTLPSDTTQLLIWLPESGVQARVRKISTLLESLKEMGQTVDPWSWSSEPVAPEDWQEVYKQHFKVNQVGRYVVVKPTWETYEPRAQDLVVELDPGMAFGTGLHASTVLVIHAMERMAHNQPAPKSVVDLGTGTGILAIAAAKLWPATHVLAIDNDEIATKVCKENVERNGLESRIVIEHRSAKDLRGTFSLVLANLTAELLKELQPAMRRHLDSFGHLIISGLVADAAPSVAKLYCKDLTMEPEYSEEHDGWRAYLLEVRE
jgi:ribosomal protein L11 methyltransferase